MNRSHLLAASMLFAFSVTLDAHAALPVAAPAVSPAEAHQFDFMLGQWTIEVHPKVNSLVAMIHGTPKLLGTWKAKRSADGLGIEDESRIVDGSGNPVSVFRSQRSWVAAAKRWKISGFDVLRKHNSNSTAHWTGSEILATGSYVDEDGTLTQTRTRYCQITPMSFRMIQDRSTDDGKTWDEGKLTIDARRSGPVALH